MRGEGLQDSLKGDEDIIQVEKTREERNDGKREKEGTEIDGKMTGGRAESRTNQQREQERKQ